MNTVQLIGRLTADPELRTTPTDDHVVTIRIAVPRLTRSASSAMFVDVEAWNGLAETCAAHLRSGREVAVTGRLEQREWRNGERRHERTVTVARAVDFLRDTKTSSDARSESQAQAHAA